MIQNNISFSPKFGEKGYRKQIEGYNKHEKSHLSNEKTEMVLTSQKSSTPANKNGSGLINKVKNAFYSFFDFFFMQGPRMPKAPSIPPPPKTFKPKI